jgi:hypothetical protein
MGRCLQIGPVPETGNKKPGGIAPTGLAVDLGWAV